MEKIMVKTGISAGVAQENLDAFLSDVFTAVIDTFRFTEEERNDFVGNEVAQMVAAIPFIAGCEDAKRTSLAHLSIYFTELRGGSVIFDHSKDDNNSIYTRLRLISLFKGGDESVIHHGMTILALIMLEGYKDSAKKDIDNNIYNPLNDGSWDYEVLKTNLWNDIRENPVPELDRIILDEKGLVRGVW